METTIESREVRLPRTAVRQSAICFAKLLERVDPRAVNGFQFQGKFLRPGSVIAENEMPARAVLLEGAGTDGSGKRDSTYLYILWQYDWRRHEWKELARTWSTSWEWSIELAPIAERALQPVRPVADLGEVAQRISMAIETELRPLSEYERARLAGVLHDRFASILSERVAAVA